MPFVFQRPVQGREQTFGVLRRAQEIARLDQAAEFIGGDQGDRFTIPALNFRGAPTGVDIRRVVELGITPRINTGIAHREAGIGQVGAGLVRPPMSVFEDALIAYADKYLE